jgi:hypothetical protein
LTLALIGGLGLLICRVSANRAKSVWLLCFTFLVAGGVTMMIAHAFIHRWGIRTTSAKDGLWAMMDGTAYRPFVYRRLAPSVVRVATNFLEANVPAGKLDAFVDSSQLADIFRPEVLTRRQKVALHVAYGWVWLALLGTVVVGAELLRSIRGCTRFEGLVSASLAICLIPLTLSNGGYIYDAPELMLWTALLVCISRRWLWLVVPAFVLILMNKESALAAVPALFPLFARHSSKRAAFIWTALLAIAAAAWLYFMRRFFAASLGTSQEWYLAANLEFWSHPGNFLRFAGMFSPGLPAPRGANVIILLLLLLPLRFGWSQLRPDMKHATALATLLLIPLFFVSGWMDETRALGPLFPFLFVTCSEGLNQMFKPEPERSHL